MLNKTDQTTQVNDYGSFNIYQFAEAFMPKKKEKLPTRVPSQKSTKALSLPICKRWKRHSIGLHT